jgi:hypothetical protein
LQWVFEFVVVFLMLTSGCGSSVVKTLYKIMFQNATFSNLEDDIAYRIRLWASNGHILDTWKSSARILTIRHASLLTNSSKRTFVE